MTTLQEQTMQASAVAIDGRAVLLTGAPGCGKSTLALTLIDRGANLIGDDGVLLRNSGQQLFAEPHPNIAGKLEIRGVGLVTIPTMTAPVALLIRLDESGERLPEILDTQEILGCDIPVLPLGRSDASSLPLRVEWGLQVHGLAKDIV